ncbi:hypothetical protein [Acetobacter sp.]|uniref:hypothetical protein n=1 Tax=Acetobacter sp. TaxID=440 RepID=UPI0039EBE1EE
MERRFTKEKCQSFHFSLCRKSAERIIHQAPKNAEDGVQRLLDQNIFERETVVIGKADRQRKTALKIEIAIIKKTQWVSLRCPDC